MKTGITIFQAIVAGGALLLASGFSFQAQAATTLSTANKTTLDSSSDLGTAVAALIGNAPAADKTEFAKAIVAYLAGKAGMTASKLQAAVKAAVANVPPGNAAGIAAAAVQAASSINSANLTALAQAAARGATQGAPGEAATILNTLTTQFATLATAIQTAISTTNAIQDVGPTQPNPTDNSTSTKQG